MAKGLPSLVWLAAYMRGNKWMKAHPMGLILSPLTALAFALALALALSTTLFLTAYEQVRLMGQNSRMGLALLGRDPRTVTR